MVRSRLFALSTIALLGYAVIALQTVFFIAKHAECGEDSQLKVALYPFFPDPHRMADVIKNHWMKRHPEVTLELVNWDAYKDDPPADLDVFEYDAIFLDYMVRNNYVAALRINDVQGSDDILQFALRGSMVDGNVYGIPHVACTSVLFYRKHDCSIGQATSIFDLRRIIGCQPDNNVWPPKGEGLLIDLSGGTTCACFYIDALLDLTKRYSQSPFLGSPRDLNDCAIRNLRLLTQMAGRSQALYEEQVMAERAQQFGQGCGRAYIGYPEMLYFIPKAMHSQIAVRTLPLCDTNSVNLLFVDILSINPAIGGARRELAIELANLIASPEVVLDSLLPADENSSSQYLLPVRRSVLNNDQLLSRAPLYRDLQAIYCEAHAFRLGAESRQWLREMKSEIKRRVTTME